MLGVDGYKEHFNVKNPYMADPVFEQPRYSRNGKRNERDGTSFGFAS